jgi:hypothetical protein
MAIKLLEELIEKQDNFEILRDQIALLLVSERDNQVKLAQKKNLDSSPWQFKVFTERNNPFESWQDGDDETPIVNIWFDQSQFTKARGNSVSAQHSLTSFNIDCYALGVAENDKGAGHIPGDELASYNAQALARLVRNILMSGVNTYLQLRGLVWSRSGQSMTAFQPQFANNNGLKVEAIRYILNVEFNESSPQINGKPCEEVVVKLQRAEDGEVIGEMVFDYTEEG